VPTASEVQPPWRSTPSVYGPSAVVAFRVAAWLGGASLHGTALWLSGIQAAAFLATGALLLAIAVDERRRARVAVLWFANPVLLLEVVGGAHVDGIVMLAAIAGLAVFRRSRLGAGALVGLGIAAKLTAGIVGLGMALVDRRSPQRLAALAAGAVTVAGGIYLASSPFTLDQTRRASTFVSPSTPWWWVRSFLEPQVSASVLHAVTDGGSLALAALVAIAAFRVVPTPDPGDDRQLAARAALCCSIGNLFGTAYVLPWYDSLAWALIPLAAASVLDELLLLHTTILGLGMLPGRKMALPEPLRVATVGAHAWLAPAVGLATLVVLGLRGWRPAPRPAIGDHSGVHGTASLRRSA
jgi:hypothetical protein